MNIFVVEYSNGDNESPFEFTLGVFTTLDKARAASFRLFANREFMTDEAEDEYCHIVEFEADAKEHTVNSVHLVFNPIYENPGTGYVFGKSLREKLDNQGYL